MNRKVKRYYSILILLFFTGNIFGQKEYESKTFKKSLDKYEKKMVKNSLECREGIKEAAKDFLIGKGKYFSIGDLTEWHVIYDKHMENKLKIETIATGCTPDIEEECYNFFADYKLMKIYGEYVFEELKIETDSLINLAK